MYVYDLGLSSESEQDLKKIMMDCFVEVYRIRSLKINAHKSKVMAQGGEGLE